MRLLRWFEGGTASGRRSRRPCCWSWPLTGVEPEDTRWWPIDDLWLDAFLAVVVFIRAGAERRQVAVTEICDELQSS